MKHLRKGRTLGRKSVQESLLKNLAKSLLLHEKIETTEAKSQELRPYVERLITRAGQTLFIPEEFFFQDSTIHWLWRRLLRKSAPNIRKEKGGYTRIIKTV